MGELLSNKIAIITGGASGIGKATALEFVNQGAVVAVFDYSGLSLNQLKGSERLHTYLVDVRRKKEIRDALQDFEGKTGGVNVLVNNAGINPEAAIEDISDDQWQEVLSINLTGAKNATQVVGGRMRVLRIPGSIVMVTSIHTHHAFPDNGAYDTSKLGLAGFMRVTAKEWAKYGIRCNAVAPGAVYPTGITERFTEKQRAEISREIPMGRWGRPEEIAKAIVFLASDDMSSYVTGSEIRVDGGWSS